MTDPTPPPSAPEPTPPPPDPGTPPTPVDPEVPVDARDTVSQEPAEAEAPSTEPADAVVEPEPAVVQICQHELNPDGETVIPVPKGTKVLDVHKIGGAAHVRTIERQVKPDTEMRIVCVPLGGVLKGRLQHIVARASGAHYFVVQGDEQTAEPAQ